MLYNESFLTTKRSTSLAVVNSLFASICELLRSGWRRWNALSTSKPTYLVVPLTLGRPGLNCSVVKTLSGWGKQTLSLDLPPAMTALGVVPKYYIWEIESRFRRLFYPNDQETALEEADGIPYDPRVSFPGSHLRSRIFLGRQLRRFS